jgi:hypothetical protein
MSSIETLQDQTDRIFERMVYQHLNGQLVEPSLKRAYANLTGIAPRWIESDIREAADALTSN